MNFSAHTIAKNGYSTHCWTFQSMQNLTKLSGDYDKVMAQHNTWVSRMIQCHIHTGWWSLVNWMARSTYETLYMRHMNINEMASWPWGWHWPLWWLVYQRDTPTGGRVPWGNQIWSPRNHLSTSDLTSGEHLGVNWGFLITILPEQPVRCITNRLIMRTVKCLCAGHSLCWEMVCDLHLSALALWHWHDFELLQLITWSYEGDSSYLRSIYTERKQMWCHSHKGS